MPTERMEEREMGELAETLKARIAARQEAVMQSGSCGDCKAFRSNGDGADAGQCRRYPPTLVAVRGTPVCYWPEVGERDWCIEHVPGGPSNE